MLQFCTARAPKQNGSPQVFGSLQCHEQSTSAEQTGTQLRPNGKCQVTKSPRRREAARQKIFRLVFHFFLNFFSLVNNNFGPARRPFACSATTTPSMYIAKCVAQAATNKQNKQNFLRAAALRICEHAVQLSLLPPLRHFFPPPDCSLV